MEKIPRFYFLSCIAKAFEFISSQSTFHLVGLNELSKNQKFALNLLNQLTTKSWEWHPQQSLGNDTQNKVLGMTPKTAKKKEEKGQRLSRYSKLRRFQMEKIPNGEDSKWRRFQGFTFFLAPQRHSSQIDGRPREKWTLAEGKELEVVETFCYFGGTINGGDRCSPSVVKRVRAAWGKIHELLPLVTSRPVSLSSRGYIYRTYIRKVLTYVSESWASTVADIQKLQRNDRVMVVMVPWCQVDMWRETWG